MTIRHTILCLIAVLPLAACAVESPPAELAREQSVTGEPADLRGACSPRSLGFCAGQAIGTLCQASPRLFCLPANEAPDGSVLCGCQGNSSI